MIVLRDDPRLRRRAAKIAISRAVVLEFLDHAGRNEGELSCPSCDNMMTFKRSSSGLLTVQCTGTDCASWFDMQLRGGSLQWGHTCDWSLGESDTWLLSKTHKDGRPIPEEVTA